MDLSSITGNPIVKTLLNKQLKKLMVENNVQMITVTLDEKGELAFTVYDGYPVTIIEERELTELKETVLKLMQ